MPHAPRRINRARGAHFESKWRGEESLVVVKRSLKEFQPNPYVRPHALALKERRERLLQVLRDQETLSKIGVQTTPLVSRMRPYGKPLDAASFRFARSMSPRDFKKHAAEVAEIVVRASLAKYDLHLDRDSLGLAQVKGKKNTERAVLRDWFPIERAATRQEALRENLKVVYDVLSKMHWPAQRAEAEEIRAAIIGEVTKRIKGKGLRLPRPIELVPY